MLPQAAFRAVFGVLDTSDAGLAAAFAKVDTDSSGGISFDEMRAFIASTYGGEVDTGVVDAMMKAADADADGELDLDEFKAFIRKL